MRTCFVPRCDSGAKKCKDRRHMFKAPSHMLDEWSRLIPRKDKKVTVGSVVCHLHFDERYLVKTYDHVINGEKVTIDRGKWKLTHDAVPTLFPNLPKYLSKRVPKKRTCPMERRERTSSQASSSKKQTAASEPVSSESLPKVIPSSVSTLSANGRTQDVTTDVALPTTGVTRSHEIRAPQPAMVPTTAMTLATTTAVATAATTIAVPKTSTTIAVSATATTIMAMPLPLKCLPNPEVIVLKRKFNKLNYRYNKLKRRMKLLRAELKATNKERMADKSEVKEVSKEAMESLSERQRNIIKHTVLMASCTEARQMRFNTSWMLDSLILRTRSPSEYDYLRDNAFLPLPSRHTLSRYVKDMGSDLGFDELFERLDDKQVVTKCDDMNVLSQDVISEELEAELRQTTSGDLHDISLLYDN